jgi:hypothetical protein
MTHMPQSNDIDIRGLLKILFYKKWIFIGGGLIGAVAGLALAFTQNEVWQAKAIIMFDRSRLNAGQISKPAQELAESAQVRNRVANKAGVKLEPSTDVFTARAGENELYLRTLAETPELAGQLAKLWAETVALETGSQSEGIVNIQRATLSRIVEARRKEFLDVQAKLSQFVRENDIFSALESHPIYSIYSALQSERNERKFALDRLTAEHKVYSRPDISADELLNSSRARRDDTLTTYRKRLADLDLKRIAAETSDKDEARQITAVQDAIRTSMLDWARKFNLQVRLEIESLTSMIDQNDQVLAEMQTRMGMAKNNYQMYSFLQASLQSAEKRYLHATQQSEEFETNNANSICTIIIDGSQNTDIFKKKQYKKYAFLGAAAAVFLVVLFIVMVEGTRIELSPGNPYSQ